MVVRVFLGITSQVVPVILRLPQVILDVGVELDGFGPAVAEDGLTDVLETLGRVLMFTLQPETLNFIVMIAKKTFSMDVLVDLSMTKLFLLAEYVYHKTTCKRSDASFSSFGPSKDAMPTIRFSNEDRMVEGELFK